MTMPDDDSCERYAQGVKPAKLRKDKVKPETKKPPRFPVTMAAQVDPVLSTLRLRQGAKHLSAPVPLDPGTERRLRQGKQSIEATLDLHGLTQSAAHSALLRFMARQMEAGRRYFLIITGRGRGGESVLRANLPRWCAEPPLAGHVMTLKQAAPKHGGDGAWYVILRRQRNDDF